MSRPRIKEVRQRLSGRFADRHVRSRRLLADVARKALAFAGQAFQHGQGRRFCVRVRSKEGALFRPQSATIPTSLQCNEHTSMRYLSATKLARSPRVGGRWPGARSDSQRPPGHDKEGSDHCLLTNYLARDGDDLKRISSVARTLMRVLCTCASR